MGGQMGLGSPVGFSRRTFLEHLLAVVVGASEASIVASLLLLGPHDNLASLTAGRTRRVYDVTRYPYRAAGDGSRDDAPAVQAAINDAGAAGGGIVYLPPGTYLLGSVQEQPGIRFYLLNYFSGVWLVGAGRDLTTLRAGAGLPDQTRIISADAADGKSRVSYATFQDFTIDGQPGRQPDARSCVGISNVFTHHIEHLRIRIKGVKGTPEAEGACFDSYDSMENSYHDCEALQGPGSPTGSGFSATRSTHIAYQDCRSAGSAYWQGFTTFLSRRVAYQRCHGYGNRQRGLNCEASQDVHYVDCQAGGKAMGNHGDGIYVFRSQNVEVTHCLSLGNQRGIVNLGSSLRVVGGQFVENTGAGLAFDSPADLENTSLEGHLTLASNGLAPIVVAGQPHDWSEKPVPSPDLPVTSARR